MAVFAVEGCFVMVLPATMKNSAFSYLHCICDIWNELARPRATSLLVTVVEVCVDYAALVTVVTTFKIFCPTRTKESILHRMLVPARDDWFDDCRRATLRPTVVSRVIEIEWTYRRSLFLARG